MFIPRVTMESMEGAEQGVVRRKNDGGAGGARRSHRSVSNHSSSSTSSDILVAPGPMTATAIPINVATSGSPPSAIMAKGSVRAEVSDGRLLVVRVSGGKNLALLQSLADQDALDEKKSTKHYPSAPTSAPDGGFEIKHELPADDDDGPNHRGTFSKAYTLKHPEIKFIHRGQGRYIPAPKGNRPASLVRSQSSLSAAGLTNPSSRRALDTPSSTSPKLIIPQRRRGSWAATEQSSKDRLSLRRRLHDAQTKEEDADDSELRSSRSNRRAKTGPLNDPERRSSRQTNTQTYAEDEDDDSDMAGEKELTYDKDYVEAHPDEKFYHTGNGWYKKGTRPRNKVNPKHRESEGHAVLRKGDGTFEFDNRSTIHVSQLGLYPGVEFHHCGNGWYKAGPDRTGHRSSRIGGELAAEGAAEDNVEEEIEEDQDEEATVSKAYVLSHPEIDWVHRGKGRYKRASVVNSTAAPSESFASQEPERDQTIYTKEYVQSHPGETFHHRGNARYMRGPPPEHWASARRRRSAPTLEIADNDDGTLYSKAYVQAHPEESFHHRGQGRYARGPRKMVPPEDSGNNSDFDMDGLVDTDYVDAHPNETFHHRGQGRWARGLPPVGASNKVAIRGPGARDKSDSGALVDEQEEGEQPPPITALVVKADGPDKFPGMNWYYRGGGKWGRITKQEFEEMSRSGGRKPRGRARVRNNEGADAQLEREAADAAGRFADDGYAVAGGMGHGGFASQDRPTVKRRRRNKNGIYSTTEDGGLVSKPSSKTHSQAPTPKPRMLEPHEDVLAEEDLPSLYRGDDQDWTPDASSGEDDSYSVLRNMYRPINPPEKFVKGMTKHDPSVRPTPNLMRLADNAQDALDALQREYLMLERITAPHARIPRKPHKGGRVPVDPQIFEDKKEADLYDYTYDPKKVGYQDPEAQSIQRDAEGRELRNRRNRSGITNNGTLPGWNFGDDESLGPKRAVKPVNRFDGIVNPPRKRARNSATTTGLNSKAPSMTPDRAATPLGGPVRNSYLTTTRLTGNVPKRVRELRDDPAGGNNVPPPVRGSGVTTAGSPSREASPGGTVRKGRPPGSKNLHKRKDAGIKKGPRKPKVVDSIESPGGSEAEGDIDGEEDVYGGVEGDGEAF